MLPVALLPIVAVIGTSGVFGHVCIAIFIIKDKHLRNLGNAFLINLTLADILVLTYLFPMAAVQMFLARNPFGETWCQFHGFAIICLMTVSVQTHSMIALNRFTNICLSAKYRSMYGKSTVTCMLAWTWLFAGSLATPPLIGWGRYRYDSDGFLLCVFDRRDSATYTTFLIVSAILLPLSVISACYLKIFVTVKKSKQSMEAHATNSKAEKREMRLTLTLFMLVVTFTVFWLPVGVLFICEVVSPTPIKNTPVHIVCCYLCILNSFASCVVYIATYPAFRTKFKRLFRKNRIMNSEQTDTI